MGESSLEAAQRVFTAHLRDPLRNPPPAGVRREGMDLYVELSFAVVRGLLADSYPVLRSLHDEVAWRALVRGFYAHHVSRTHLFGEVGLEFLDYLQRERDGGDAPPFLGELAHYERMESQLRADPREIDWEGVDRDGDLLAGRPVLSPLAWPLRYRFPVHRIGPECRPREAPAQPTYLLVYRDEAYRVGFLELNAVSARLIELMAQMPQMSGRDLLARIAAELDHPDPAVVECGGLETLQQLRGRQIILGTRDS